MPFADTVGGVEGVLRFWGVSGGVDMDGGSYSFWRRHKLRARSRQTQSTLPPLQTTEFSHKTRVLAQKEP